MQAGRQVQALLVFRKAGRSRGLGRRGIKVGSSTGFLVGRQIEVQALRKAGRKNYRLLGRENKEAGRSTGSWVGGQVGLQAFGLAGREREEKL